MCFVLVAGYMFMVFGLYYYRYYRCLLEAIVNLFKTLNGIRTETCVRIEKNRVFLQHWAMHNTSNAITRIESE